MELQAYIIIGLKIIIGISILNVWLIQSNKHTKWRGGNATTIEEEEAESACTSVVPLQN